MDSFRKVCVGGGALIRSWRRKYRAIYIWHASTGSPAILDTIIDSHKEMALMCFIPCPISADHYVPDSLRGYPGVGFVLVLSPAAMFLAEVHDQKRCSNSSAVQIV